MDRDGFTWTFRNPHHIDAHRADFARPPEKVVEELREQIARMWPGDGKWVHADFACRDVVGKTGLVQVPANGTRSFWAYRSGRTIPSHLAPGEKSDTRYVCVWGFRDGRTFVVHTMYPGRRAPREIHDPEIDLRELPDAIRFWSSHAIVVNEGEYSFEPDIQIS